MCENAAFDIDSDDDESNTDNADDVKVKPANDRSSPSQPLSATTKVTSSKRRYHDSEPAVVSFRPGAKGWPTEITFRFLKRPRSELVSCHPRHVHIDSNEPIKAMRLDKAPDAARSPAKPTMLRSSTPWQQMTEGGLHSLALG